MGTFYQVKAAFNQPLPEAAIGELRGRLATISVLPELKAVMAPPVEALHGLFVGNTPHLDNDGDPDGDGLYGEIDTVIELHSGGATDAIAVLHHEITNVVASVHVIDCTARQVGW